MSNVTEIWPAQVRRDVDKYVKPHLPKSLSEHAENVAKYAAEMMRVGRKINANADPKEYERYMLTRLEYNKRGVNFLPRQVLKKIFRTHGLH